MLGAGLDQVEPDYLVVTEMIKTSSSAQEAQVETVVLTTHGRVSQRRPGLSSPPAEMFSGPTPRFSGVQKKWLGGILSAIEWRCAPTICGYRGHVCHQGLYCGGGL